MAVYPDESVIKIGLRCLCPRCHEVSIFKSPYSLDLREQCPSCHLDLSKNDSADGPAVFLIFLLGFSVVPLAVLIAMVVEWPLWVHAVVWSVITLGLTIGLLKPLKAYIIALQYKHRPGDWE